MQERSRSKTVVAPRKAWLGKNTRALIIKGTAAFLLLVFATISLHGNWPVALLWVSSGVGLWGVCEALRQRRERASILKEVDAMTEGVFRRYAADLLRAQGYTVHEAGRSVEPRVDLLLTRGRETIVCWLQRQAGRVSEETVAGAVAAMEAHGNWRVMILSNQSFTRRARSLARREGCVLIGRESLANLVMQHRQGHRVLIFHREETMGLRRRK
ncbi:MAG: restriction endonuclease [Deltaproteobacteria bacterium]|nr:restriction endonuclease [Deltaproteobacteria bacterium]